MNTLQALTRIKVTYLEMQRSLRLICRNYTTAVAAAELSREELLHKAKPFSDVPQAKRLPLLGTTLDYTPLKGYKPQYMWKLWQKRHQELGPIFKEKYLGCKNYIVFVNAKEDLETLFREDGSFPERFPLEGLTYVLMRARDADSLASLTGEEWYKFRKVINPILLHTKTVWKYVRDQYLVSQDLADYIMNNRDKNGEVPELETVLRRWGFEMGGTFILESRLGALKSDPEPLVKDMIESIICFIQFLADSILGFKSWEYYETKQVKKTIKAVQRMMEIMPIIAQRASPTNEKGEPTALYKIMNEPSLTEKEKVCLLSDLMIGAVDTTAQGAALFLYSVASNPDAQEKLRREILELSTDDNLNGRTIDRMVYMNSFIKEATRLYPLAHSLARTCKRDIVLSGYRIPAGTSVIMTSNSTQNRNPDYFPEPDKFLPERWMNTQRGPEDSDRFKSTGSFGYGARACPGRRFAMQEIRLLLMTLLPRFQIEYHHEPIESIVRGTGSPSQKPRFKFFPLDNAN